MATSAHFVKNYKKPLHFVFPVGVMVKVPPLWQLKSGDNKIMLQNQYIYQHGEHYVLPTDVQPRQIGGKITRKGPGVYTNLILDIKNESVVFSGRWSNDLFIL